MKLVPASQHLQDCFVFLCITDTSFLKIARQSMEPKTMSAHVTQDVLQLCFDYFDAIGECPNDHIHDEMVHLLDRRDDEVKRKYFTYLKKVSEMEPPNRKYILKRINAFIRSRALEAACLEMIKHIDRGDIDVGEQIMTSALRSGIDSENFGITFGEGIPGFYNKEGAGQPLVKIGIDAINDRLGWLRRGQFICFFAGYKVGKTWAGVHLARQGLIHGLKVLYVSHEASEEELDMRMYMMLGGLTSDEENHEKLITLNMYGVDSNSGEVKVRSQDDITRGSVHDIDRIYSVQKTIAKFGGKLIIKKYDMASCTVGELERFLDALETHKKWIPDIVINDYVEKMRLPLSDSTSRNDRINEAYIQLKRMADERQILMATASQVKTPALEASTIDMSLAAAEDSRKLGNIDIGIFFGQTKKDTEEDKFTAYVLVNRSGDDHFGCTVSKKLEIGQFHLHSWPLPVEGVENQGQDERYQVCNEDIEEST